MAPIPVDKKDDHAVDLERTMSGDAVSFGKGDILQLEHLDPALNAKMHLVNNVSHHGETDSR